VATDVAGDFPAPRGMADHGDFFQIELVKKLCQVVGILIHVIPVPGLARAAMSTAIVRDAAIAVGGEVEHLCLPRIGRQRPAVAEADDRAGAPVLIVNRSAIFGGDCAHGFRWSWVGGRGTGWKGLERGRQPRGGGEGEERTLDHKAPAGRVAGRAGPGSSGFQWSEADTLARLLCCTAQVKA
jgi:hypothetical protein